MGGQGRGEAPAGHVYGWQIEPITDGECLVSHYCDRACITDELRAKFSWPVVPADRLENSVENLDRLATRSGGRETGTRARHGNISGWRE